MKVTEKFKFESRIALEEPGLTCSNRVTVNLYSLYLLALPSLVFFAFSGKLFPRGSKMDVNHSGFHSTNSATPTENINLLAHNPSKILKAYSH